MFASCLIGETWTSLIVLIYFRFQLIQLISINFVVYCISRHQGCFMRSYNRSYNVYNEIKDAFFPVVRILFSFLSKEALSFDSRGFLSITFSPKYSYFFVRVFFSFFNFEFIPCIDESRIHYDVYLCWNHQLDLWNATRNANCYVNSSHLTLRYWHPSSFPMN